MGNQPCKRHIPFCSPRFPSSSTSGVALTAAWQDELQQAPPLFHLHNGESFRLLPAMQLFKAWQFCRHLADIEHKSTHEFKTRTWQWAIAETTSEGPFFTSGRLKHQSVSDWGPLRYGQQQKSAAGLKYQDLGVCKRPTEACALPLLLCAWYLGIAAFSEFSQVTDRSNLRPYVGD